MLLIREAKGQLSTLDDSEEHSLIFNTFMFTILIQYLFNSGVVLVTANFQIHVIYISLIVIPTFLKYLLLLYFYELRYFIDNNIKTNT